MLVTVSRTLCGASSGRVLAGVGRTRPALPGWWLIVAAWLVIGMGEWTAQASEPQRVRGQVVKREILALYDGAREGGANGTRIHRFAELPLNHLGFVLRFHDVGDPLPAMADLQRYRGVLTWFAGPVPDPIQFLAWAGEVAQRDLSYVVLGEIGAAVTPQTLQLVNRLLGTLGLHHTGDTIAQTLGTRVMHKDGALIEHECRLDPILPGYPIVEVVDAATRIGLALETPSGGGRKQTSLVAVNRKGGYAAFNYEFCHQRPPLHRGQWMIEPFAFFTHAFGDKHVPIPDTTTVSGRRLYFAQLHSEGWASPSQIERYRRSHGFAAEAVLSEAIEAFDDLPVTVDVRDSDLDVSTRLGPRAREVESRMWGLPQVARPGRRSVGTTLTRFDARFPSLSSLAPLASEGVEKIALSASSDETAYAEVGLRTPLGFHSLMETVARTETPRRLKGFNINFHAYAGQHPASLHAVVGHLKAARAASLAPITASHYADIVAGFHSARIARIGPSSWQIENRGALQTLRFDEADGLEVDPGGSTGVVGQTRHNGALYIALDRSVEPAIIAVRRPGLLEAQERSILLTASRWRVWDWKQVGCLTHLEARGYGQGAFELSGAFAGPVAIVVSRDGAQLWSARVEPDTAGRLSFTVPVAAIEPVKIVIGCGQN